MKIHEDDLTILLLKLKGTNFFINISLKCKETFFLEKYIDSLKRKRKTYTIKEAISIAISSYSVIENVLHPPYKHIFIEFFGI